MTKFKKISGYIIAFIICIAVCMAIDYVETRNIEKAYALTETIIDE